MTEPMNFSVNRRNYGHWDICTKEGRAFAIRGGPGYYYLRDERRGHSNEPIRYKTLMACMVFVCDAFMYEHITVEGEDTNKIQSWNIPYEAQKNNND